MVFTISNAHHTFWGKVVFVTILHTFRASAGEPFDFLVFFWVAFLKCCFLPLSRGTGEQRENWQPGCGVPETITSMPSLRARTAPEQDPQTQGSQGPVDKRLRQV